MKLIKTIKDKDLGKDFKTREASRAVIFDDKNQIPLLFVSKHGYHKIPGGGIEDGENKIKALIREVKEESGCEIKIDGEIGKIVEYRSKYNLKQTSYCYIGTVISKGEIELTKGEKDNGFELVWLSIDKAIKEFENDLPIDYEGIFIKERDLMFLKEAKNITEAKK